MKISNGSELFINAGHIDVMPNKIIIGMSPRASAGMKMFGIMLAIFAFIVIAFKVNATFVSIMFLASIVISIWSGMGTADNRKIYTAKQIENIAFLQTNRVSTKSVSGSLGGAAVGAVLFGGAGAIVGSVAAGNHVQEFKDICVKFTDGEWFVATKSNQIDEVEAKQLIRMAGKKNKCPI